MAADITSECSYSDDSASSSPKNKLKFLCSHGGKILPRPPDGQLKYTGGETRVVSVPNDINFSDLMKRLCELNDGDMVLKYQVSPEDLDALVTVKSDEDLKHMIDEYSRHDYEGAPKLRTFLFPTNPVVAENPTSFQEPHAIEQRYIDAINGIIRKGKVHNVRTNRPIFSISSCSSPTKTSPESNIADNIDVASLVDNKSRGRPMHRVRSSPSISCLNQSQLQGNQHSLNYQQHHYYHNNYNGHQIPKPPHDPQLSNGTDRPFLSSQFGHSRIGTSPMGYDRSCYYSPGRRYVESGNSSPRRYYYDKHAVYSVPQSPRKAY